MSIETQVGLPAQITRGDAVSFELSDADHPPDDWTATIHFRVPGETTVSFANDSTDGLYHIWELTGVETATLPVGIGTAVVSFSDGVNRESLEPSSIQIFPDPAATPPASWARETLALVEAAITTLSSGTNSSVNINGQSFTKKNLKELFEMRDRLLSEIAQEEAELEIQSGMQRKQLVVRFAVV